MVASMLPPCVPSAGWAQVSREPATNPDLSPSCFDFSTCVSWHTCDLALVGHQPLFDISPIVGDVRLDQCANTIVALLAHLHLEVLDAC